MKTAKIFLLTFTLFLTNPNNSYCKIFDYGFDQAVQQFKEEKCPYFSLSNYEVLLDRALDNKYISKEDEEQLRSWRNNPEAWGTTLKIAWYAHHRYWI